VGRELDQPEHARQADADPTQHQRTEERKAALANRARLKPLGNADQSEHQQRRHHERDEGIDHPVRLQRQQEWRGDGIGEEEREHHENAGLARDHEEEHRASDEHGDRERSGMTEPIAIEEPPHLYVRAV
jgi:hypothetical protein